MITIFILWFSVVLMSVLHIFDLFSKISLGDLLSCFSPSGVFSVLKTLPTAWPWLEKDREELEVTSRLERLDGVKSIFNSTQKSEIVMLHFL